MFKKKKKTSSFGTTTGIRNQDLLLVNTPHVVALLVLLLLVIVVVGRLGEGPSRVVLLLVWGVFSRAFDLSLLRLASRVAGGPGPLTV